MKNKGAKQIGNLNYSSYRQYNLVYSIDYSAVTLTTKDNRGGWIATTTHEQFQPYYQAEGKTGLRIRKLTPKECFRLMGVKDEDSDKLDTSNNTKYHLAGDSIVTTVLMAIFGEMLGVDWEKKIKEVTEIYGRTENVCENDSIK